MSPKIACRLVPRISLSPGLCLGEKVTAAEISTGGVDGGGEAPGYDVRIETLLPEDLLGGWTPNLDLVTVPNSHFPKKRDG